MAGFLQRYLSLCGANDKRAACSGDYIIGDNRQAINFHDALNLHKQACVTHFFARLPWVPLMTMVALRSVLGQ